MAVPNVVLVDDNPITRKLVRSALEREGLAILEAGDAHSALELFRAHDVAIVLQDLCLPDMDGYELVQLLRALPGGSDVPILVLSGMLSHHEEARVFAAGFDDVISKPVDPARLVQVVRAHLPSVDPAAGDRFGSGRRLVVADDDAVQRKLVCLRMQKLGFDVVAAADGNEALELARRTRPHAVLSDVLMPGLDGFGLCLEVRRDPVLARVPIVLTTNSYVEATDRELARRAGANDLVLRTPELREVMHALRASLRGDAPAVTNSQEVDEIEREHMARMMRQLERQVTINTGVNQRCALLAAEITVLKGISEALASHTDIDEALEHTLAACFDAAGIPLGALYLRNGGDGERGDDGERGGDGERGERGGDPLRVLGFGAPPWTDAELLDFFGERALLTAAIDAGRSTLMTGPGATPAEQRVLARAAATAVVLVPIVHRGVPAGALVMVARDGVAEHDDRIKFGEAVAGQISQALALAEAFRAREQAAPDARRQAAILRSVVESIGDGVCVADGDGQLILWNSAANDIVAVAVAAAQREPAAGSPSAPRGIFETDMITPVAHDRGPLIRATRGEALDGVEVFVRHDRAPDGAWFSVTGRPWRDEQGVARGAVAVYRDVTRDKALQTQLLVSDRMASVGMLAAGVGHEINNPLASVLVNLELAQRELADRDRGADIEDVRDMLADAREGADRVRQIVRDLKMFSRHEDVRAETVDVHKALEATLRMAWNEIRHRARLEKDYGEVALVDGSESRLGQVFLNLIVNAAQALPEGQAERNAIRIATRQAPGGDVIVEISDTGSGIAPDALAHLFRPFYATKQAGVGTGLGLAISHRIVTGLGGQIQVESEVGVGTTFRVSLPAARSTAPTIAPVAPNAALAARRARVLVVDDEPMIGAVIRRTLEREHDVVVVDAARTALDMLCAGELFDVVFCDLMMPDMTGMDLHAELRARGLPVADLIIFLTGGAFTPAARAFLDAVPNQRVEKPFAAQHLRALVNDRVR
jgi:CheY-like chemotaxis protein